MFFTCVKVFLVWPIQTRTVGGLSETDVNELAVMPCIIFFSSKVVTTVTPVAKFDIVFLYSTVNLFVDIFIPICKNSTISY